MGYGGSDKYYDPTNKVVYNAQIAEADDLNSINSAVDVSFGKVADDLDLLEDNTVGWRDTAEKWATDPLGVNPDALQPDKYSSFASSLVSESYAIGNPIDLDGVLTGELSAKSYQVLTAADLVATNADVVLTHADVVQTGLDLAATNADVVATNADVVTTGLYRDKAQEWAESPTEVEVGSESAKTWALSIEGDADAAAASAAASAASAAESLASENAVAASAAAALASENAAALSETNADDAAAAALVSQNAAASSETNAATSAANALTSETNAATSEANVDGAEAVCIAAETGAVQAYNDTVAIFGSAQDIDDAIAESAANAAAAQAAEDGAQLAETGAQGSESICTTAETNATNAASAASTSETNSAVSAAASASSASAAAISQTEAGISETNADGSETASAASAVTAEYWADQASSIVNIGVILSSDMTGLSAKTLDAAVADVFDLYSIDTNFTVTLSGMTAGRTIVVFLDDAEGHVTWPTGLYWQGGGIPDATADIDCFVFTQLSSGRILASISPGFATVA